MKLRTTLLSAGAGLATVAAVLGAATPAFAKSDTTLTGPRTVLAGHQFRLTVSVGDDAGARQAAARLQILGAHGRYSWYGPWQRLRIDRADPYQEAGMFTLRAGRHGTAVFRVVVTGYMTSSPLTIRVR